MKKKEETEWLNEVCSQALQHSLRCLETAYLNFFRGNAKFPKFKSKKENKNSFTSPHRVAIKDNRLCIFKFREGIKINLHREIEGEIHKATISKTPSGKYYASILVEEQYEPATKTGSMIGIDLGLKDFIVTSNNEHFKNPKFTKKYEKRLAKVQRHLNRKKKGSNSYEKQRRKVALVYEKITNSRKDNLHKISKQLVVENDIICVETLNVKGMIKNPRLAKHIADASWGTFVRFLEYKANWNDKQVIKINRFYPSSKTCHKCGWIFQGLKLSMRSWQCIHCQTHLDRDENAAINILNEGLRQNQTNSAGTVENTGGEKRKTSSKKKHISLKPEAIEFL